MGESDEDSRSRAVVWFSALTGIWLLFNLVAMPLAWGGVNASGGFLRVIQGVILAGFVLVLLFDLISLAWISFTKRAGKANESPGMLLALGVLSLVGLMGAKVMVDEIARETPLGGAGGEWGVLYAALILQLSYIVLIFSRANPRKR